MPINDDFTLIAPEYYAALPDLEMALERMGLDPKGDYSPSKENLQILMTACLMSIPYETLDCSDYKRNIDIAPEYLFEKIVLNRRGGYCYELNGFFMSVLQALGYDCKALMSRILFGKPVLRSVSHRVTLIEIDGTRYLCDVGYGAGCAEGPIELDYPGIQQIKKDKFSIKKHEGSEFGDFTLMKYDKDGNAAGFYMVYMHPQSLLEYISQNEFSQRTERRDMRLLTDTGSISVDGTKFRRKIDGEVFEEEITSYGRFYEILTKEFKMVVPRTSFSKSWPREFVFSKEEFLSSEGKE